jgi:hypothetical protein
MSGSVFVIEFKKGNASRDRFFFLQFLGTICPISVS